MRGQGARDAGGLREVRTFFSSPALRDYARKGIVPVLPAGTTASEQRGRRFFEDVVELRGQSGQGD